MDQPRYCLKFVYSPNNYEGCPKTSHGSCHFRSHNSASGKCWDSAIKYDLVNYILEQLTKGLSTAFPLSRSVALQTRKFAQKILDAILNSEPWVPRACYLKTLLSMTSGEDIRTSFGYCPIIIQFTFNINRFNINPYVRSIMFGRHHGIPYYVFWAIDGNPPALAEVPSFQPELTESPNSGRFRQSWWIARVYRPML